MASLIPNLGTPSADAAGAMRNYLMASQALSQAYQAPIDIINKLNAENALAKKEAKQEARQAELDAQNKQLFDLKMQEVDRANKDRESLVNFNKGMLQPQVISGIITDTISPEQVEKMSFTPEELAQYNAGGGDLSKLTGSARTKAELQNKLSSFADTLPTSPEFQESDYQQAQRVASGMELTPGILEELKKYQVADVLAQKENKKEGTTYAAEAKELETKIAQLKTKQGSILDKQAGVGKEWGKSGSSSGSGTKMLDSGKMLKYSDMVKDTDSAEELQGMIKEVFINPNIPEKQKESIAANIVLSSGAKLPQGLIDFGKLNVSVEDAQKATTEYLANLQNGVYGNPNGAVTGTPKEVDGIDDEIALLEARRNAALAKANSYSDGDRLTSARELMGSRLDALLGGNNGISTGGNNVIDTGDKSIPLTIRTNNPGAVKNASRSDKNAMWEGQTGFDEQGHAVFSSPEYGARAMAKNLKTQIDKGNTLTTLLKEYATGNQEVYIKNVANKTGLDPNTKLTEGDIRKLMGAMVEHEAGVKNPFSADVLDKGYELALGKLPSTSNSKDVDVKSLFAKVEESRNSKGKDPQEVIDYYTKKREDIANIKTNAWDRTVNAFKGGPTVDDGYGKLTGKSYSKDISNVADALRKDGFSTVEDIAILATNMPEGKDKEAVANVLHYKLMQSDPEYRQLMKEKELNDAAWLAGETILSAVPVGKVVGNVAKRVLGPGTNTTALPNGWAGTTGREAMEKAATQAAAEKAAAKAAMQKKIAALEHDLQQVGGELSKNKVGSGMTRSGLENDFARIRKEQKELQDRLKSL